MTHTTSQTSTAAQANTDALMILLQLEASARRVQEAAALTFFIVNETRRLLAYRQAILFKTTPSQAWQVHSISSIAVVDRNAPMLQWLEQALPVLQANMDDSSHAQRFDASRLTGSLAEDWAEFSLAHVAWVTLRSPDNSVLGGLWLAREHVWQDTELALLEHLAEAYAHAWQALPTTRSLPKLNRALLRNIAIGLGLSLLIPVKISALAPVEVIAKQPLVVSAPLDGVIANISVTPNQSVKLGQLLLRFEDTVLRSHYEVADKTLAVAEAEHMRAMQGAFLDEKTKADVALLKAKADLARSERDYAHDMLARVEVHAQQEGVAIFRDSADWDGKPVSTGERIMEIANPKQMALRINLPVKDAVPLAIGAEVRAFFDADPLHPLTGSVSQASYQAEAIAGDVLAYRLDAELEPSTANTPIRIGWQGTAKVYGERAPLLYYLLRRPFAALRQTLGI